MNNSVFARIRHIDLLGQEVWTYSDLTNALDIKNPQEALATAQLDAMDDGIDLKLHIWFDGDEDYVLDRTMCGYLLAACPDWYDSVKEGREYFECSQVRRARAIVSQLEIDNNARVW